MHEQVAIRGIASMATRRLLEELAARFSKQTGWPVAFEAVGGLEAARRVEAGESFDMAVLASNVIDALVAAGRLNGAAKVDIAKSGIAIAVRSGTPHPDICSEEAVRKAVCAAVRIGYSTGPSGTALLDLLERWGLAHALAGRLVRARPGQPVGSLLAAGAVDLGLQQLSELVGISGIDVVGSLPDAIQVTTVFSAAPLTGVHLCKVSGLLDFLTSPASVQAKLRNGLKPI